MHLKNLEKYDILKMRKKSTLVKISSVWCWFLCRLDQFITKCTLILYKTSLKTIFLQKSICLHF